MFEMKFSLFSYLTADLRRFQLLASGVADEVPLWRLWMKVLSPRFIPVLLCRLAYWFYCMRLGPFAKIFSLLNFFLFGIEIAVRCKIGRGIFFPHTHGTVIGAFLIGENVTIFQGVTVGAKEMDFSYKNDNRPIIENNVVIGSGAKVLGGVILRNGVVVGANAVVLESVPSNSMVAGIPAKVLRNKISGEIF